MINDNYHSPFTMYNPYSNYPFLNNNIKGSDDKKEDISDIYKKYYNEFNNSELSDAQKNILCATNVVMENLLYNLHKLDESKYPDKDEMIRSINSIILLIDSSFENNRLDELFTK